jgi:hypothetical protein
VLDTILLWDSLFAENKNRHDFLYYMCCTMVLEQKEQIMKNDFAENMELVSVHLSSLVNLKVVVYILCMYMFECDSVITNIYFYSHLVVY